jgi:hypothetical protein
MAWTTPRTFVAAELLTASIFNTHLRDNLNFLRDTLLGSSDLGSNWKISSGRKLTIANATSIVGDATAVLQVSRSAANETDGLLLENANVGGWGNSIRFYSRQNFSGNLIKEAARLMCTGSESWTSDALTSSNFEIHTILDNTLTKAAVFSGQGLNVPAGLGLAVGYTGVPTAGALMVGDADFKLYLSSGNPTIQFNSAGAGIQFDRSNSHLDLGGALLVNVVAGQQGVTIGSTGTANNEVSTIMMGERADPAAPAANYVRIYAKDNGAGKTQLMAIFAAGAAQQIAIQP